MSEFSPSLGAAGDGRNLRIDIHGVHYGSISAPLDAVVMHRREAKDPYFWGRLATIIAVALGGVTLYALFHWVVWLAGPAIGSVLLIDGDIHSRRIYFLELSCPGGASFFSWADRQIFRIERYERRIEDALALARDGIDPEFDWEKKRKFETEEDRRTKDPAAYEKTVAEAPLYRLGRLQFRKKVDRYFLTDPEVRTCCGSTRTGGATCLFSDRTDDSVIWFRSSRWVNVRYNLPGVFRIDDYIRNRQSIIATDENSFLSWGEIEVSGSGVLLHWADRIEGKACVTFLPHGLYEISVATFDSGYIPLKMVGRFSVENDVPTITDRWENLTNASVGQNTTKVMSL